MNLIVDFKGENLWEWKPIGWRRLSFPSCESMVFITQLEASISKINGLEKSAWMKSGAIMKDNFKDRKALSTLTP